MFRISRYIFGSFLTKDYFIILFGVRGKVKHRLSNLLYVLVVNFLPGQLLVLSKRPV